MGSTISDADAPSGRLPSYDFIPGAPADLAGRVAVDLLEHAAEKLVIAEAVLVQDLEHRFVCRTDIMVDMCQADMVGVLSERDADILAEHAAEVVAVEAKFPCDLLERKGLHIVVIDVRDDLSDPKLIAAGLGEIFFVQRDRKIRDQPVKDIQRDRLSCDPVALGLTDMESHQLLEAFADLQVLGDELIGQLRAAADDLESALVAHQALDQFVIDAENDHHVGVRAAGLMDLVGVDDDEFAGHELVLCPFQIETRITVQNIDKFQGVVPMRRGISGG